MLRPLHCGAHLQRRFRKYVDVSFAGFDTIFRSVGLEPFKLTDRIAQIGHTTSVGKFYSRNMEEVASGQ